MHRLSWITFCAGTRVQAVNSKTVAKSNINMGQKTGRVTHMGKMAKSVVFACDSHLELERKSGAKKSRVKKVELKNASERLFTWSSSQLLCCTALSRSTLARRLGIASIRSPCSLRKTSSSTCG